MEAKDPLVFRVAELFFQGKKATEIRDIVNQELEPVHPLTREGIYPLLVKARQQHYIRLVPPLEKSLADEVSKRFRLPPDCVKVVQTGDTGVSDRVAAVAAERVTQLLRGIESASPQPVGIGLGPGRATLDFSRHLSEFLRADWNGPQIKLFAIASGCVANTPEYAPSSFFNLFPRDIVVERVGLFAETLVRAGEFHGLKQIMGVREAFRKRKEIGIIVTSMGDMEDEHDSLRLFLKESNINVRKLKEKDGWIGNVQYRPYTARAPVVDKPGDLRAVTLFELSELARLAREKHKYVVLIARRCGYCGRPKGRALRPLLEAKALRVFTDLVIDTATARELLGEERTKRA